MKFFVKVKRSRNKSILHFDIETENFNFFYRPAIEYDSGQMLTFNRRFVGDTPLALQFNKRLDRIQQEWEFFCMTVENTKKRLPTEEEVFDFFYGCSTLVKKQREIIVDEFLTWSYEQQKEYYKYNIHGKLVEDWQKVLQNCIECDSVILSSKDLFIFALRFKIEILNRNTILPKVYNSLI
jgi:hypothetical protein